jgi:hypothetical protein
MIYSCTVLRAMASKIMQLALWAIVLTAGVAAASTPAPQPVGGASPSLQKIIEYNCPGAALQLVDGTIEASADVTSVHPCSRIVVRPTTPMLLSNQTANCLAYQMSAKCTCYAGMFVVQGYGYCVSPYSSRIAQIAFLFLSLHLPCLKLYFARKCNCCNPLRRESKFARAHVC